MMEKIFITVEKSTRMVSLTKTTIGNDLENLQEELVFKFSDGFVNGSARLEYKIGSEKHHIPMTKEGESYTIPIKNVITKEGKIEMQLVVVEAEQNEEIPVFKSNVFYVYCNKSINAQTEAPDDYEYWLDVIQTKLAEIDDALEEVDNLDIDVSKSGTTATVSITNKEGISKSVQIYDGEKGQDATINGESTVTISAGTNIEIQQNNGDLKIVNTYDDSEIKSDIINLQNNKADRAEIPDVSSFVTKDVNNLTYYTKTSDMNIAINNAVAVETQNRQNSDVNLQSQIDAITSSSDVVDIVGTYSDLQNYDTSKLTEDDVIKVLQDSTHNNALSYFRWSSNAWEYIGSEGPFYTKGETDVLLNAKQNTINSSNKLNADLVDDSSTTNKFVTSGEKTTWGNKYDKPLTGIPKSDLSSEVQTSLGKADTAVQDVSGKEDKSNKVTTIDSNSTNTQYPSAKCVYDSQQEQNTLINDNTNRIDRVETLSNLFDAQTGTGIEATINGTSDTMLKLGLSGNTYQYSTTGKNLFDEEFRQGSERSLENTANIFSKNNLLLDAGTYTFSCDLPMSSFKYAIGTNNTGFPGNCTYIDGFHTTSSFTFTLAEQVYVGIMINKNNNDIIPSDVENYNFQIENGSTATSYEPYTNGASPNPDYPQDIEVVTGDNEIKVSNRNLFDISTIIENKTIEMATGEVNISTNDRNTSDYIMVEENTKYTCNVIMTRFAFYDKNKTFISSNTLGDTITTPNNAKYLRFSYDNSLFNIQLEKGTTATTYVEHKEQVYPITLGVENLFDKTQPIQEIYVTESAQRYGYKISVKAGTYTVSGGMSSIFTKTLIGETYATSNDLTSPVTLTLNSDGYILIYALESWVLTPYLNTLQLEKGPKANSHSQYGTIPMELCKIGDYKDSFRQSIGKNLFDKNNATVDIGHYKNDDGVITSSSSGSGYCELYIKLSPNTTYTISGNDITRIYYFDGSKGWIRRTEVITLPYTFTTPNDCEYIQFQISGIEYNKNITQIELGSSATEYEPYGVGTWYKHAEIGKVIFDGSETITKIEIGVAPLGYYYTIPLDANFNYGSDTNVKDRMLCSNFQVIRNAVAYFENGTITASSSKDKVCFGFNGTEQEFSTYLSTHNTNIYYQLETPTNTEITDATLISQLNAIKYALAYKGQTNISQTNNEQPFIIDYETFNKVGKLVDEISSSSTDEEYPSAAAVYNYIQSLDASEVSY